MDRVCVLMSTYNGERFLRDQINSVLQQTNVEVLLLIRDDGSVDGTIDIINEYIEKNQNIRLIRGKNMGPAMSFLELLKVAPGSDYYAFCDQDDVWMKEKLSRAVHMITNESDENQPSLYFSNLILTDSMLNPIKETKIKARLGKENRYVPLVDNVVTGCTVVMNNALRALITENLPGAITMHDVWCNIVCSLFGKVVFDQKSFIYYRQHENNTVGMDINHDTVESTKIHLKRLNNKNLQPRKLNAGSLLSCFGNKLNDIDKMKVTKMVDYDKTFVNRVALLFDFSIHSFSVIGDLRYRLLIIVGEI